MVCAVAALIKRAGGFRCVRGGGEADVYTYNAVLPRTLFTGLPTRIWPPPSIHNIFAETVCEPCSAD